MPSEFESMKTYGTGTLNKNAALSNVDCAASNNKFLATFVTQTSRSLQIA